MSRALGCPRPTHFDYKHLVQHVYIARNDEISHKSPFHLARKLLRTGEPLPRKLPVLLPLEIYPEFNDDTDEASWIKHPEYSDDNTTDGKDPEQMMLNGTTAVDIDCGLSGKDSASISLQDCNVAEINHVWSQWFPDASVTSMAPL